MCRIARVVAIAVVVAGGGCAPARRPPINLRAVWSWDAPPPSSVGLPASDGHDVAVTSGHQDLTLLDGTGRVRWRTHRLGLLPAAPTIAADAVLAATDDGVVAVRRADGARRWDVGVGDQPSTPVLADGRAVVSTWDGSFVALDMASGTVAWKHRLDGYALGPPATDGHVAVATWERDGAGGATAVDVVTGAVRWTASLRPGGVGGPAVVGDTVVVVDDLLRAHALDLVSGRGRWSVRVHGAGSPDVTPVALTSGDVLVPDRLAGLTLVGRDGKRRWHTATDGAAIEAPPAAPAGRAPFAFPLDDGRLWLTAPGRHDHFVAVPGGRVSGVAAGPAGTLIMTTGEADQNRVVAYKVE